MSLPEIPPEAYVVADQFPQDESSILDALAPHFPGVTLQFVDRYSPDDPRLVRSAERLASETKGLLGNISKEASSEHSQLGKLAAELESMLGENDDEQRQSLINSELDRIQGLMEVGMGIFCVWGAEVEVEAFLDAYKHQPDDPAELN